ncbi:DUF418 domain-containing protein [Radiobacillus sp. PE A8.2]|uniref:DUF418 domain-containing protein n=1 Tax=Radiobacillus sp. PE A8.2 TaxID=3380349 RepID=UPI00388F3165
MNQVGQSLAEKQRLEWIDTARGLAILGIFMVNAPAFNAPFFQYGGESLFWTSKIDHTVQTIIDIFFQASFYTLFSFLFGFGIQQIVDRLKGKQLHVHMLVFRRLMILIGFGLIHAFLIWHGDILLSYGIIGMLLLLFIKRKTKTLLYWAFGMLIFITVFYTQTLYMIRSRLGGYNSVGIKQSFANYGEGSIIDIWKQNYQDWIASNGNDSYFYLLFMLLPLFLLGMYVARKRWLHDLDKHSTTLKKLWIGTLVLFITFKIGPYLFGNPIWFSFVQDTIGGSASAIFYIVSVALLYQNGKQWLRPLSYVGRLSLSNYIAQSLICFLLFYSIGFGLYGEISPWQTVVLVLAIYSVQIVVSKMWLKKFRFGPLEWLWRSLMYGERQAFKHVKQEQDKAESCSN